MCVVICLLYSNTVMFLLSRIQSLFARLRSREVRARSGLRGTPPIPIGVAVVILGLCVACLPSGPLYAQESEEPKRFYRVETTEGQTVIGALVSENEQDIVIDTRQLGEVTIERANIKRMEKVDSARIRDGEYWFRNPQSTRYLFAPNAIGIPEGHGYYQNTWILLNNVNYGVSDNVSIGGGTVPIFLFGANALPIWVLPKVSVSPAENVHLAGGAVLGGVLAEENVGVGLVYGASTIGNRDHNATFGLGYGYAEDEFSETPVINVSGMTRISRTTYLISENYFFAEGNGVISFGVRWAPENFAVDFALFRPLGEDTDDFIAAPWLGVTIPFGQ